MKTKIDPVLKDACELPTRRSLTPAPDKRKPYPRNPRDYLQRFYFDSCVHDDQALRYLLDVTGVRQVMLGTDYPFPLGEQEPGSGIEALRLDEAERARLFHGTALEWLGLPRHRFVPDISSPEPA